MTPQLSTAAGTANVFRIGRRPDPWAWPDWAYVSGQNRWDDPGHTYRVLYACTERQRTFAETLARFRPDPAVVAGVAAVSGPDDGSLPPGHVPRSWITKRAMGSASLTGRFVDIGHNESLAVLRSALAPRLVHYRLSDLDGAAVRSADRAFTQEISQFLFQYRSPDGAEPFAGIHYLSRLGDDFHNWAIFENPGVNAVTRPSVTLFAADDVDLRAVLAHFHLTLVDDVA